MQCSVGRWAYWLESEGSQSLGLTSHIAGPIMAGLAGAGIGGAVGGVAGALVGMGIPQYEAKHYEGRLKKGRIVLSAYCDTSQEIKQAKEIMQRTGAEEISSADEASVDSAQSDTTRIPGR